MALKKNEKTLLAVLGGIVAVYLIWTFVVSGGKKGVKPPTPKNVVASIQGSLKEAATTAGITPPEEKIPKMRFDTWERDPFRDFYAKSEAAIEEENEISNLEVKGFIQRGSQTYVLINDLILTEGEEKEGLFIERIDNNQVFCKKGGKWFTLTWKEES
jgi:hypothetical protein